MSRKNRKYGRRKRVRQIKNSGESYQPWLIMRDFQISKIGKHIDANELASRIEFAEFLLFDLTTEIIDIREQIPLIEIGLKG